MRTRLLALWTAAALALALAPIGAGTAAHAGGFDSTRSWAEGEWAIGFQWSGVALVRDVRTRFGGSGAGTLSIDGTSASGPYRIPLATIGVAPDGGFDGSQVLDGTFDGSADAPCLTGTVTASGTLSVAGITAPVEASAPVDCDRWPLLPTTLECNVAIGEWSLLKQTQLELGAGFRFVGAPSMFWATRTAGGPATTEAATRRLQLLLDDVTRLATAQPVDPVALQSFLDGLRGRLPRNPRACGRDAELQALARVLIAQLTDQGVELPPRAVADLARFAARVDAFGTPGGDLVRRTERALYERVEALADDPTATADDLYDAAAAARRLGWRELDRRLAAAAESRP